MSFFSSVRCLGRAALLLPLLLAPARAAEPFFAPARPSGSLPIVLRPTEAVVPGKPVLVTFGVPFPRGSIADAGLIAVRSGAAEVPVHVDVLAPWRSLNGTGAGTAPPIRVARVQLTHVFRAPQPETLTLVWGSRRQKDVADLRPPRSGWHKVGAQAGAGVGDTFAPEDGVEEPDVYALLPREWLARSGLYPPMAPLPPAIGEAPRDPRQMKARKDWPGFSKYDQASVNFFYTAINWEGAAIKPEAQNGYRRSAEPWLFDRAGTFFAAYLRSGFYTQLREAVRAADFYRRHLYRAGAPGNEDLPERNVGMFDLKVTNKSIWAGGNGSMYSYAEPLVLTWFLTGDDSGLDALPGVCAALEQGEPTRWRPDLPGWTERHTALNLLGHVWAFEATGADGYRRKVLGMVQDFLWHQDGAGGAIPKGALDGALWHRAEQHGDGTGLIASPWMSALTVDAMLRAYLVSEDPRIAGFIARMGRFQQAACKAWPQSKLIYDTDVPLLVPDYVTSPDGKTNEHQDADTEHAIDVAAAIAWGAYFTRDPARRRSLQQTAASLYRTYEVGVDSFTRPGAGPHGLPAYRVTPDRKYNWMYHWTGSLSWLLGQK